MCAVLVGFGLSTLAAGAGAGASEAAAGAVEAGVLTFSAWHVTETLLLTHCAENRGQIASREQKRAG